MIVEFLLDRFQRLAAWITRDRDADDCPLRSIRHPHAGINWASGLSSPHGDAHDTSGSIGIFGSGGSGSTPTNTLPRSTSESLTKGSHP